MEEQIIRKSAKLVNNVVCFDEQLKDFLANGKAYFLGEEWDEICKYIEAKLDEACLLTGCGVSLMDVVKQLDNEGA